MKPKKRVREIFGEVIARQDFGNFSLVESVYPPNATMPCHTHEIAHMSIVLRGSFTEVSGRKQRPSEISSLIVHPADEEHEVTFHQAGARVFSFHIKPQLHQRIRDVTNVLDIPAAFRGGQPTWLAVALYRESKTLDDIAPLTLEGLALEIIAASSPCTEGIHQKSIPRCLSHAKEYLDAPFTERISFAGVADLLGVHPVYLSREFRRRFHYTMADYVRRLRVESACQKMRVSDLPIDEVALAVGFYDQSHLSNAFRRLTGTTPAQYRRIFRQH